MKIEMTPTLTNAQKYSPEYGFEVGVVVEIDDDLIGKTLGFFHHFGAGLLWLNDYQDSQHPSAIEVDEIKSIRLLSGPWAIWNFAPPWATICTNNNGDIVFYDDFAWSQHLIYNPTSEGQEINAPWWWLEGQK